MRDNPWEEQVAAYVAENWRWLILAVGLVLLSALAGFGAAWGAQEMLEATP